MPVSSQARPASLRSPKTARLERRGSAARTPFSAGDRRTTPIRIVIAGGEWYVREAFASIFSRVSDLALVGEATTAPLTLALLARHEPDVVLIYTHLPDADGFYLARRVRDEYPKTAVIVLTDSRDKAEALEALRSGVNAYIGTDESDPLRLCEIIRLVAGGATLLTNRIARELVGRLTRLESPDPAEQYMLTRRECEVLALIAEGFSNRQIAGSLVVAEQSVKNYVRNVFVKLGVENRTSAALLARREGLVG